jgi:hypothetical protein
MFPTDTIPATFEQYVELHQVPEHVVAEHHAEIREMYDRARLGAELHPVLDDMPACPAWCALGYGHRYETVSDLDLPASMLTLSRFHTSEQDPAVTVTAFLSQEESLRDGQVSHGPVFIVVGDDLEEIDVAEARKRAAALLALADRLDAVTD